MSSISLQEFADKLNEILPSVIREFARRQANELYKGKITLPQFIILDFLNRHGDSKMVNLAHFMGVSTPNVTGIVDRLVKYGYVIRVLEPKDRRIIKIRPTNKGFELVKKINSQRYRMIINIFGKLSQNERSNYLRILMRIHEILTKTD